MKMTIEIEILDGSVQTAIDIKERLYYMFDGIGPKKQPANSWAVLRLWTLQGGKQ